MSKHVKRHGFKPDERGAGHTRPGADDAVMSGSGVLGAVADIRRDYDQIVAAADPFAGLTNEAVKADPFHAEDKTFSPQSGVPSIVLLNAYLNDFRKANPNATLLQMIPTGSNSYLIVWEL